MPRKGTPGYEAWREKFSAAMRKKWSDPAYRERVSNSIRNGVLRVREKYSAAKKRQWAEDEQFRRKQKEGLARPECRQRISEANRRAWADPESRARRLAKMSEGMKRAWVDPAKREKWRKRLREAWAQPEKQMKKGKIMREWWGSLSPEQRQNQLEKMVGSARLASPSSLEERVESVLQELGVRYEKQVVIWPYAVDFLLLDYNAILECYGTYWHSRPEQQAKDRKRSRYLISRGYRFYVVWQEEILSDCTAAVKRILQELQGAVQSVNIAGANFAS